MKRYVVTILGLIALACVLIHASRAIGTTIKDDMIFSGSVSFTGGIGDIYVGDGSESDGYLFFNGNAVDFMVGIDDSEDDFVIGYGSTMGTDNRIVVSGDADDTYVTLGDATENDTCMVFDGNSVDYAMCLDDSGDELEINLGSAPDAATNITMSASGITMAATALSASLSAASADQFKVDAQGTVAGDAINLETTNGGVLVNADGAANGDITLNAEDDITITAAGVVTLSPTTSLDVTTAAVDIDLVGGDFELDTDYSVHIVTTEAQADQFYVNAQGSIAGWGIDFYTNNAGILINADGPTKGDISIDAQDDITLIAGGNVALSPVGNVDIDSTGVMSVDINSAAADQFKVDAQGTVAGYAINLETTDGGVLINADGVANGSIDLNAEEGIQLIAGDAIALSAVGNINVDGTGVMSVDINSASADQFKVDAQGAIAGDAINFETTDGGVLINADGAANGDITLNAEDDITITAAGDVSLSPTGALNVRKMTFNNGLTIDNDTDNALEFNENSDELIMTFGGGAISYSSGSGVNRFRHFDNEQSVISKSTNGAGDDWTISMTGATDSSIHMSSSGTGTDALRFTTTAGGMYYTSVGDINFNTPASVHITPTEAAADQFKVDAQGAIAGYAVNLETTDGGVLVNADGAANGDITLNAEDDITITAAGVVTLSPTTSLDVTSEAVDIDLVGGDFELDTDHSMHINTTEAAADQFKIDAQGAIAGYAINFETTNGGMLVNADGANGGIDILAESGVTLSAGGSMALSATGNLTIRSNAAISFNGDAITNVLDDAEVVTAANVLTASECGKVFFLNSGTEFQTTLPAISTAPAGCWFEFYVDSAPVGDHYTIITGNSLENVITGGALEREIDTGTDGPYLADFDTIKFIDGTAVKGDYVKLMSDGSTFYMTGIANAHGGLSVTQAD